MFFKRATVTRNSASGDSPSVRRNRIAVHSCRMHSHIARFSSSFMNAQCETPCRHHRTTSSTHRHRGCRASHEVWKPLKRSYRFKIRQRNESRPHKRVPFHRRRRRCPNTNPPCLPRLRRKPNLCRRDARAINSARTSPSCRLVAKDVLRHPGDLTRAAVQRHLPAANRREARKHQRLLADCRDGFRPRVSADLVRHGKRAVRAAPFTCMRCAGITARSARRSATARSRPGRLSE